MSRKIDEDVDAVAVDGCCRILCRKVCETPKMFDGLPHFFRIEVLCIQCIDRHRKTRRIECRHQGIRKGEHDVLPHIGREIPDAKPPLSHIMQRMVKCLHIRKERTVDFCRTPVLCKCGRQIVTVKEHVARVERTQNTIRRSVPCLLIEGDRIRRASEETRTLSRKVIDLFRDCR